MIPADTNPTEGQVRQVQDAFSRQSPVFDSIDEEPMIQWVRTRVRAEVMKWFKPGDRLLEINCGTGIDSIWFSQKGLHVTATDNALGMLAELNHKQDRSPSPKVTVITCSFLELEQLDQGEYDAVFSNFGGINCTEHLPTVLQGIDGKLGPGGVCALVIMPRFSPWELIEVVRGNIRFAFRRFKKGGSLARVEGVPFHCWYHDAKAVLDVLTNYEVLDRMALSFFVPPPHLGPFAGKHPRMTRWLERIENTTCRWPFIRSRGDHYLLILRKQK
ncbi:MAG: class I SAM-dependent methyltransferase [Flavobacteriales bacterium]|nr:class I SAM-dependent methyltransferase [Flavobacteriales bacterium]